MLLSNQRGETCRKSQSSGLIELMDITPIANRTGTQSQVVMTTRVWSCHFAPDPRHHSLHQQIEMRTGAPQLRDMIRSMIAATVGEDRVPFGFSFVTESEFLLAGSAQSLGVVVNRNRKADDYLVLHPAEQWFADYLLDRCWFDDGNESGMPLPANRRFEDDLNRLLKMASTDACITD